VEAGLRSYNRAMPEELNRVVTDHLSDRLFCPTRVAVDNLAREGVTRGVVLTGDIMTDSVYRYADRARRESAIHAQLDLQPGSAYAVATIHRPANTDSPEALAAILQALQGLPLPVIFPVHPRTRKMIVDLAINPANSLRLIEPVGYVDMLALVEAAQVLITDSGGLQKEAYLLRTPCVTVRTETEWVETVHSGWNRLTPPDTAAIIRAVNEGLSHRPEQHPDFYGDGQAARRMVAALMGD
jgi:UDP-N-acetylglucosamine 2-epimerase